MGALLIMVEASLFTFSLHTTKKLLLLKLKIYINNILPCLDVSLQLLESNEVDNCELFILLLLLLDGSVQFPVTLNVK